MKGGSEVKRRKHKETEKKWKWRIRVDRRCLSIVLPL